MANEVTKIGKKLDKVIADMKKLKMLMRVILQQQVLDKF